MDYLGGVLTQQARPHQVQLDTLSLDRSQEWIPGEGHKTRARTQRFCLGVLTQAQAICSFGISRARDKLHSIALKGSLFCEFM